MASDSVGTCEEPITGPIVTGRLGSLCAGGVRLSSTQSCLFHRAGTGQERTFHRSGQPRSLYGEAPAQCV